MNIILLKKNCKNDNNCIYYSENKCKYKHLNNTLNSGFILNINQTINILIFI